MKIIKCRDCGKELYIPKKSKKYLCEECKNKSFKNHFKIVKKQKILCKNCNNVLKIVMKKGSTVPEYIKGTQICNECRVKQKITKKVICPVCHRTIKEYLIHNTYQANPIKYQRCYTCWNKERQNKKIEKANQKVILHTDKLNESRKKYPNAKILLTDEKRLALSKRMKKSNPMFDLKTRKKARATILKKIQNKEIIYKKGEKHHLYKGNRNLNMEIRKELYSIWIKPILERDNFKCTKCGETKALQVHHITPLRDIINQILKKYGIDKSSTSIYKNNCKEMKEIIKEVISLHKLEDGITVCKECHEKLDYYYRPFKNKLKER